MPVVPMPTVRDDYVLDLALTRRGLALNQLLGSLMSAAGRDAFRADEAAYCDRYGLPPAQRKAVLDRDYPALLEEGASVFRAFKLTMVDGRKMQHLSAAFTGMTPEEFDTMMRAGGRLAGGGLSGGECRG